MSAAPHVQQPGPRTRPIDPARFSTAVVAAAMHVVAGSAWFTALTTGRNNH